MCLVLVVSSWSYDMHKPFIKPEQQIDWQQADGDDTEFVREGIQLLKIIVNRTLCYFHDARDSKK